MEERKKVVRAQRRREGMVRNDPRKVKTENVGGWALLLHLKRITLFHFSVFSSYEQTGSKLLFELLGVQTDLEGLYIKL